MGDPISKMFGGGGNDGMNPMMMMALMPKAPPTPPPVQSPVGSPSTNKPNMGQSFVSSAAPAPSTSQPGGKTLLGQ